MSAVQTEPKVQYVTPRASVRPDAEGYTLEIELPGVDKSGVELTVEDGTLTIVGQRAVQDEDLGRAVYRERVRQAYRRSFELDPSIDGGKVSAGLEQGLLTVRLPKAEAVKPRRIEIA